MKLDPLISVVVPIYNVLNYVPKCIESVVNQTYRNIQLILVDDGSDDGSAAVCDRYASVDERICVIHKINEGVSAARNVGLKNSEGEFIIFVDADDWLHPYALTSMMSVAKEECADVVTCDFNIVSESRAIRRYRRIIDGDTSAFLNSYLACGMTSSCGCLINKNLFLDNKLKFPLEIKYCEDVFLMGKLLFFSKKQCHIKEAYYNYFQRSSSVIHNFNKETMENEICVCQALRTFYDEEGVGEVYSRTMNWRMLKATQELVLTPKDHRRFVDLCCNINNRDIWSCPLINNKVKVMAFLILNRCGWIVVMLNYARTILRR